jgi:general stress protein 26
MHAVERIATLAEILPSFVERAHSMIWANLTTLDRQGRPRSRIIHPIWDGETGWIGTLHSTPKARQIERNPHVSVAYIMDVAKPVYAECLARWVSDLEERRRIWELFRTTPEPLGYDPASFFGSYDQPDFGLIQLTPIRVEVTNFPHGTRLWQGADA